MHHPEIYTGWMIGIRLAKYPKEVSENRSNFEVINEFVHEKINELCLLKNEQHVYLITNMKAETLL